MIHRQIKSNANLLSSSSDVESEEPEEFGESQQVCACGETSCVLGLSKEEINAAKKETDVNKQTDAAFSVRCSEYRGKKLSKSTPSGVKKTWAMIHRQIKSNANLLSSSSDVESEEPEEFGESQQVCACGETSCVLGLSKEEINAAKKETDVNKQTDAAFSVRCSDYKGKNLSKSTPSGVK